MGAQIGRRRRVAGREWARPTEPEGGARATPCPRRHAYIVLAALLAAVSMYPQGADAESSHDLLNQRLREIWSRSFVYDVTLFALDGRPADITGPGAERLSSRSLLEGYLYYYNAIPHFEYLLEHHRSAMWFENPRDPGRSYAIDRSEIARLKEQQRRYAGAIEARGFVSVGGRYRYQGAGGGPRRSCEGDGETTLEQDRFVLLVPLEALGLTLVGAVAGDLVVFSVPPYFDPFASGEMGRHGAWAVRGSQGCVIAFADAGVAGSEDALAEAIATAAPGAGVRARDAGDGR